MINDSTIAEVMYSLVDDFGEFVRRKLFRISRADTETALAEEEYFAIRQLDVVEVDGNIEESVDQVEIG